MTRKKLLLAGWLAMVSALLTIPWFILTFLFAETKGATFKTAETAMVVASTALTIFLLLTLQQLLNRRYGFHEADVPLRLMVKVNLVAAVITVLSLAIPALEPALGGFGILVVLALGGLQIFFGVRLLQFPDNLQGLHKPYCYLNIAAGICLASLLLLPLGILLGAVADVMLGTIFLQAAARIK